MISDMLANMVASVMTLAFYCIVGAILVEAICQAWSDAVPLRPIKKIIKSSKEESLWNEFLDCKYCQSFWVSLVAVYLFGIFIYSYHEPKYFYAILFFVAIIIHRLSNYVHAVFDVIYYYSRALREEGPLKDLNIDETKILEE